MSKLNFISIVLKGNGVLLHGSTKSKEKVITGSRLKTQIKSRFRRNQMLIGIFTVVPASSPAFRSGQNSLIFDLFKSGSFE